MAKKQTKPRGRTKAVSRNAKSNKKTKISKWSPNRGFKRSKLFVFIGMFGVIGLAVTLLTSAATTASFEAESATKLNNCVTNVDDANASAKKAIKFECGSSTTGFTHPGVVYTQADIDNWSTSSTEYQRLASTSAGSLTNTSTRFVPVVFGDTINSGGLAKDTTTELYQGLAYQSQYAKIQAILFGADSNDARKQKVISYLEQYRTVQKIEWDSVEQWRLIAGWSCTNLSVAAEIIDYRDAQFQRFLRDVCYPIMDWYAGPNWHASFADSKLAIAAYLGDAELWADAKAYFYERIKQSFYHSKYDGNKANPMHKEDKFWVNPDGTRSVEPRLHAPIGTPNLNQTKQMWGPSGTGSQIKDDYTFNTSLYGIPVDGMNAERTRDLGHVSMGLAAWAHGARTILAQGEKLEQHAYDRLLDGYDYHADRVLYYAQTGQFKEPVPNSGDGGGSRFMGYESAVALFGSDTPQSVRDMLNRDEVKNRSAADALHFAGDYFAASKAVPILSQPQTPTEGVVKGTVNIDESATYTLWVRMRAADATNNSVKAEVGPAVFTVGDNAISTSGWTWINYNSGSTSSRNNVQLAVGNHTVTLSGTESGVLVDKVMLVSGTCVPTQDGSNCVNVSPSVSLTAPTTNQQFISPATVQLTATASDPDGNISKVEFYRDNTKLGEDTSAPYEYSWDNVAEGTYALSAVAMDSSGATGSSNLVSITVAPEVVTTPPSEPDPTPEPSGPIAAPSNFIVTDTSKDSIKLQWDSSTDPRVDLYSIRYTRSDSPTVRDYSTWTYPRPISETNISVDNLDEGTVYLFQLRARDSNDTASFSDDTNGLYTTIIEGKTPGKPWWKFWSRK